VTVAGRGEPRGSGVAARRGLMEGRRGKRTWKPKMEPDLGTLVEDALEHDAAASDADDTDSIDPLGVREEDFARMASAFGMSEQRLRELLRDPPE